MHIEHLSLTNFRNFLHLELNLPPHIVVFQGDNAQGKTNLLEAIYLLATTKSPRATADREFINWDAGGDEPPVARLLANVQKAKESIRVEIALRGEAVGAIAPEETATTVEESAPSRPVAGYAQKRIRVNGIPRRALDLIGQINVVLFSPEDIELIGGSPSHRRRYLDMTVSQVDSRYLRSLQRYNRVLLQRNHLLRMIRERRADTDQLPFWDEELVDAGSYLIAQRRQTLAALNKLGLPLHAKLTGGEERLRMVYLGSVGQDSEGELLEAKLGEAFREALRASREKEILQGMSVIGPHRDDLRFLVNGVDMGLYGSRGQQRTIALSLRLAEAKFILGRRGEAPVLLLDDVLSELDVQRRQHLLESTASYEQVLITTTDLDRFEPAFLDRAAQFKVVQGTIQPLQGT